MTNPDDTKKAEAAALSFKPSPTVPLYSDLVDVYPDSPGLQAFEQATSTDIYGIN